MFLSEKNENMSTGIFKFPKIICVLCSYISTYKVIMFGYSFPSSLFNINSPRQFKENKIKRVRQKSFFVLLSGSFKEQIIFG